MTGDPTPLGSTLATSVLNDVDAGTDPLAAQPSALGLIEDRWESVPPAGRPAPAPQPTQPPAQTTAPEGPVAPAATNRGPHPAPGVFPPPDPRQRRAAAQGMASAHHRAMQQLPGAGPAPLQVEPLRTAALDTTPLATTELRVDPLHAAPGSSPSARRQERAPRRNSTGQTLGLCAGAVLGFGVPVLAFAALVGSLAVLATAKHDRGAIVTGTTGLLLSIVALLAHAAIR